MGSQQWMLAVAAASPEAAAPPSSAEQDPGAREDAEAASTGTGPVVARSPATVDSDELAGEVRATLEPEATPPVPLDPPLLQPDAFDWVRFDNGEWFGGDLKEMRGGDVTFDSDKLGAFTEDWADVLEFRSARSYTYVDEDLAPYTGPAVITPDEVAVRTPEGIVRFPRSKLLSVIASSDKELDRWSLKLSIAATARAGNTESVDFNQYLRLRRQDRITRGTLESTANLGDVNGTRTVQNWNGSFQLDLFVHPNIYVTPVLATGQHNSFQNLLFRGVVGGGAGVHAIDTSWLAWDLEAMLAYQYTESVSALPPAALSFDDAVVGIGTSVEWDITDDVDFDVNWRTFIVATAPGRTYHNGSARLSIEINDWFDLDLATTLNRIEEPAPDASGNVPRSNDWTFTAGVGIDL